MGGAYFDWVQVTAEALQPYLSNEDSETYLCDEARNVTLATWAELIKAARVGAEQRGIVSDLPRKLLENCLRVTMSKTLQEETDPELLSPIVSLLADCIKNAG